MRRILQRDTLVLMLRGAAARHPGTGANPALRLDVRRGQGRMHCGLSLRLHIRGLGGRDQLELHVVREHHGDPEDGGEAGQEDLHPQVDRALRHHGAQPLRDRSQQLQRV